MAITYDADDPPGSELSSRREGIGFTSDRTITEIRAVYSEEIAYTAEGGFVAPFTGSTKTGNHFDVVRRGGWQRDFTLYPEEEPESPPTTGQEWGAIYEVDLTSLASQTLSAGGSYTIDGLTWWQKVGTQGARNSVALTNGSGLGLTWVSSACGFTATGNIEYRMLTLPLAQIADFNADSPLALQMRFAGGPYTGVNYVLAGLIDAADSAAAWASADRNRQMLVGVGAGSTSSLQYAHGVTGPSSRGVSPSWSDPPTGAAWTVIRATSRGGLSGHGVYSGGFPDPYDLTSGLGELISLASYSNPCFGMMFNCQSSFTAYLTHLRIMQPRIAS